jgi:hypothetical protein
MRANGRLKRADTAANGRFQPVVDARRGEVGADAAGRRVADSAGARGVTEGEEFGFGIIRRLSPDRERIRVLASPAAAPA